MRSVVDEVIAQVFELCRHDTGGAVADYIPELASADPDRFGICVVTSQGHTYEIGDSTAEFTIQSISKPLTYAMALADRGPDAVAARVDVEPSGEPFNEISLDPITERPRNPMINAGAITMASMVGGRNVEERFERVLSAYSAFAGRRLRLDEQVYRSEARTGYRNRAIGYMLRSFDILGSEPDAALDLYFRQCSIALTCRDLGMMAATLANNGVNPLTRERVLAPALVERTLSVMTTCGMYDAAGAWVAEVGLPAKSGVGGGVLAVLPGQLGIAVFSPRLDAHGNSVRGVQACRELSRLLELHFMHVVRGAHTAIRSSYPVNAAPSRKRRTDTEQATLRMSGQRGRVYELHGDLLFAGAETVVREISGRDETLDALVLDVQRVGDVARVSRRLISDLLDALAETGCQVAVVDPKRLLRAEGVAPTHPSFDDIDLAVQWCEDRVLDLHCAVSRQRPDVDVVDHPMLSRLSPEQADRFLAALEPRVFARGDVIAHRGEPARWLALITSGEVSQLMPMDSGIVRRVVTLSAGMSFGESPLLTGGAVLTDTRADTKVRLMVLPRARFEELSAEDPALRIALLEHVVADAHQLVDTTLGSLTARRLDL
ncbi:glutaminase A [Rhodococcus sp. D2-41]|uniref:Glutaminase n=1 Tax=Speluncibacter jeojiensis TaxID=2710754 RepID=A0A9X4M3Q8_9ACTN|nr:glutaminase A [Rhodococcus sp. D2-41]MDG3011387.1 glutaminase A [Rhodococcus sp. D2-41]MDG3016601.1 glutaminase A [Corynebacteriales bacterium D3-21]